MRVAEQRSFTQAAQLVKVSQPTLSRIIRELEVELGINLFRRTGRGVQLTPPGRRFLDHARGILQGIEAARLALRDPSAHMAGRVMAGLTPSLGQALTPAFAARFVERFPQCSLSVVEGLSDSLLEQVFAGRLDFAVLRNPPPSSLLSVDLIAVEPLFLIGAKPIHSATAPVSIADIGKIDLIMPSASDFSRPLLDAAFAQQGIMPRITFEIDAVSSIIALVQQGFGYSIIPATTRHILPNEPRVHCQPIASAMMRAALCLVSPGRPPRTAISGEAAQICRTLVEALVQKAPATPGRRRP